MLIYRVRVKDTEKWYRVEAESMGEAVRLFSERIGVLAWQVEAQLAETDEPEPPAFIRSVAPF